MFVYGIRCNMSEFASALLLLHDTEPQPEDYSLFIGNNNLLIFPRLSRPSSLRLHGSRITADFTARLDRIINRSTEIWEADWLEQPYISDANADLISAIQRCNGSTPTWYYLPSGAGLVF